MSARPCPGHLRDAPQAVREALERKKIESRPVWKPMHLQPVFQNCRVRGGAVSEELFAQGLSLLSGTAMTDEDVARVVRAILNVRSGFACGYAGTSC